MFSEIVKLIPQIDGSRLRTMFADLNKRFTSVARKFGEGLKNALKLGGVVAVASAMIGKLLNPLQKAEEIIDRILNKGDDAATTAEELGTDPGKLLRLEALGQAKGVNAETMRQLLGKFQSALANEQEKVAKPERIREQIARETDPEQLIVLREQLETAEKEVRQGGTLREFVNEKDTAEAFFSFIQSMQQLEKSRQVVVQNEVFGERVRGKASELFNATDFQQILDQLPTSEALAGAVEKTSALADKKDLQTAIREAFDFVSKPAFLKESQIDAIDQSKRLDLKGENKTLQQFDALKPASIAIQELTQKFDSAATTIISDVAPKLLDAINQINALITANMPLFIEFKDTALSWAEKTYNAVSGVVTTIDNYWQEFKGSKVWKFGAGLFGD